MFFDEEDILQIRITGGYPPPAGQGSQKRTRTGPDLAGLDQGRSGRLAVSIVLKWPNRNEKIFAFGRNNSLTYLLHAVTPLI